MMKKILKKIISTTGYEIRKKDLTAPDGIPLDILDENFLSLYEKCKKFSTCSIEPMYALYKSIEYIVKNNISGDLAECGIYKGGSAMMMAYSLMHFNCAVDRKLYLYDTYDGMPAPSEVDKNFKGVSAKKLLDKGSKEENSVWCYSPIEEVKENLFSTGYNNKNIIFIKGKVEDTIPNNIPEKISLLRLDTDWYSSTLHELKHLYPLLSAHGVLIIDDYGHWQGARKATDEYFSETQNKLLLHRIDYTVRVGIKNV